MRTAIKLAAAAAGALVAVWAAVPFVRPLAALLPAAGQMLSTTRTILGETQQLQAGIRQVQGNLRELRRQETLLTEQEDLTRSVLAQLKRQEELSLITRDRLSAILNAERGAVDLVKQANQAAGRTTATVAANGAQLEALAEQTGRIEAGSRRIDGQLDRLNAELEASAENFAEVARIKAAAAEAARRTSTWWQKVWEWFKW